MEMLGVGRDGMLMEGLGDGEAGGGFGLGGTGLG
jgi:hypothetical protein